MKRFTDTRKISSPGAYFEPDSRCRGFFFHFFNRWHSRDIIDLVWGTGEKKNLLERSIFWTNSET